MSLGSWFVFGYEGFPREDRRRFFSQRDDPCESDDDARYPRYDDEMRCIRRRRRVRKVPKPRAAAAGSHHGECEGPCVTEDDAYELVETSCSTSSASDGEVWGFHDDATTGDATANQASSPRGANSGTDCLWHGVSQGTSSWRAQERPVACVPALHEVPPLYACAAATLCDGSNKSSSGGAPCGSEARSIFFVHGGVNPQMPSFRRHPQNVTYAIQCTKNAQLRTTWSGEAVAPALSSTLGGSLVPRSLKRWTPSHHPPERFGHCSVTIPAAYVPVHDASLLKEWNDGALQQSVTTTTAAAYKHLQAFMVFTFGGSSNGQVPLSLQQNRMSGFALSEPFLTLLIRLSDGGGEHGSDGVRWWSSWRRLTPTAGAQFVSPRAFFTLCDFYHDTALSSCHPLGTAQSPTDMPKFLLFGGSEDGAVPSGCARTPVVVSVDTREWTVEAHELATLGVPPEPRFAHSMTWAGDVTSGCGCYVLCGGIGVEGAVLSDVFLLDGRTHVWREVVVPLTGILRSVATARAFHAAVRVDGGNVDDSCSTLRQSSRQTCARGRSGGAHVLFVGGEGNQGSLIPSACIFDVQRDAWSTVTCPLLSSSVPSGASSSHRTCTLAPFLQSDPQKLVADTALRDAFHVLHEQRRGSSVGTSVSSSFGSVCHGSAPCALSSHDAPTVMGGSHNYHCGAMSATVFPVGSTTPGGTLKEAVAFLILKHEVPCGLQSSKLCAPHMGEGVAAPDGNLADEQQCRDANKVEAAEIHARRYSAQALVKQWQAHHRTS